MTWMPALPPNVSASLRECASAASSRCAYLGEETGLANCGGCCGGVRLKKYACKLHAAECVPANKPALDKAIYWCQRCTDNTLHPN
jgi:hypothetical protein